MDILDLVFRARTTELDQAERKLDNLGKKAEEAEKKSKGLGDALGGFSKLGGPIGGVAERVGDLSDKADASIGTFGKLGGAVTLVATAAAAAVAGLVSMSLAVADAADALNDMANRSNLSTERLSIMDAMAKMAGSSVEELVGSSERLGAKLAKQDEESGKAITALKELGISTRDANGEVKSMIALQEEVVLAADKATDKAKAEGAAIQLLGNDYYKLRTAIKETAEQKSDMYDYMQKVGSVVTTKLAKDSDQLNDNIAKLGLSFKGMGNSIASITVPILNAVIERLTRISAAAADIMRRFTGGSTASEVTNDRVGSLQAQIENEEKKKGGLAYRLPANKERIDARISQLQTELELAQSDLRTAKVMDARAKDDAIIGRAGEGNRPVGKDAKPEKAKKSDRLTPEQIAKMQQDDQDQWNKELGQLYAEDNKMVRDAAKAVEERTAAYQKQADAVRDLMDPTRELNREIERINNNPLLSGDEKAAAIVGFSLKYQDSLDQMKEKTVEFNELGTFAINSMSGLLSDLATGADISGKAIARSFIKAAVDMMVMKPALEALQKTMSGMAGGGGWMGAVASLFTKSANGNVFGSTGLLKSANGNVFDGPTLHGYSGGVGVLGEAGPEAVMPLKRGANGILGVQVQGGGGGRGINVGGIHVTVQGGDNAKRDGQAAGNAAAEAFINKLVDARLMLQSEVGGLLNP